VNDSALKILVVDDDDKARARTIGKLRFPDVQVVGESTLGAAAYTWAEQLDVDIALVSVEEPVARSLRTIEALTVGPKSWPVVAISSLNDRDTMRKAIVAGVRDYLVLPAEPNELRSAVLAVQHAEQARRQASEEGARSGRLGTIVTVFAVKGGVGKSTVATNIAAALAQETRYHVALLDLDLHFGDAAVLLDVAPSSTLADAVTELDPTRPQSIAPFLTPHVSRLKLLAAPPNRTAREQW
jgi:pilus assembly protein CpaE